jgi:hypothetical protein
MYTATKDNKKLKVRPKYLALSLSLSVRVCVISNVVDADGIVDR